MTRQLDEEEENIVGALAGVGAPAMRTIRPFLAILGALLGLGLGYVYVGKLRLAMATVAGV